MPNSKKKVRVRNDVKNPGIGQGKGGGRPTVMTPEVVQKLREVFLIDYTIEEACDHADIAVRTYYDEVARNPKFAQEMIKAQRGLFKSAKRVVATEIIQKGNGSMAMNFLKHRQSDRYRTKNDVEGVTGWAAIPIKNPDGENHPRVLPDEL